MLFSCSLLASTIDPKYQDRGYEVTYTGQVWDILPSYFFYGQASSGFDFSIHKTKP